MPGKRMLHDISRSEKLAQVSYPAGFLWCSMLPLTDVLGNLEADPRIVKGSVFPLRDDATVEKISEWLEELSTVRNGGGKGLGLVGFYAAPDGKRYLHFVDHKKYQKFAPGRTPRPEHPQHPTELDEEGPQILLFDDNSKQIETNTDKSEQITNEVKLSKANISEAKVLAYRGTLLRITPLEHDTLKARFAGFLEQELMLQYGRMDEWCAKKGKRGQKRDWYKFAATWLEREEPTQQKPQIGRPAGSVRQEIDETRRRRQQVSPEAERQMEEMRRKARKGAVL